MPHFILEYTDNLKAEGDIPGVLKKVVAVLIDQNGALSDRRPAGPRHRTGRL